MNPLDIESLIPEEETTSLELFDGNKFAEAVFRHTQLLDKINHYGFTLTVESWRSAVCFAYLYLTGQQAYAVGRSSVWRTRSKQSSLDPRRLSGSESFDFKNVQRLPDKDRSSVI